ncbi:hypothetical protein AAG570_012252 [Ranatra chinensis]|uniref:Ribosome-recycling factor, mitochondrial n=1 Tax=Ranatra chinensis TaxID=642074 RepID=A0ABD0YKC5_9HEMI
MKLVQHNDVVKYQFREYAKGKDKKKSDKGRQQKVEIKEDLIAEVVNFQKMKGEMDRALEQMKEDYVKNLSLRSSAGSIESLKVNFEGKKFELIEVAQVFRQNPKTISINMSAFPQMIPPVLKSISSSGMNLNPQQDGTMIYIPVPKVTREHRETLAKNAKTLFIKCRDSVKDVQNKILKTIKNKEKNGLSVDVGRDISEQVCL